MARARNTQVLQSVRMTKRLCNNNNTVSRIVSEISAAVVKIDSGACILGISFIFVVIYLFINFFLWFIFNWRKRVFGNVAFRRSLTRGQRFFGQLRLYVVYLVCTPRLNICVCSETSSGEQSEWCDCLAVRNSRLSLR